MKENSRLARQMAKESTLGLMEKFTTENGRLGSNKATESGEVFLETLTLESGTSPRLKVTESISGRMEIGMRESGLTASNTVKEQTFLLTRTSTLDITCKVNQMVTDNTSGATGLPT